MSTWKKMSEASFRAAESLRKLGNWRSYINRAYYAVFSAVTSEVRKQTTVFPNDYEHPPHPRVGKYVKKYLTQFSKKERSEIRDAIDRIYHARLDADYRHRADPDIVSVRSTMRDAQFVLESLGLKCQREK